MASRSRDPLYDPFGKDVAAALLGCEGGRVEREVQVGTASQSIDLWYEPAATAAPAGLVASRPEPLAAASGDGALQGQPLESLPGLALVERMQREPFSLELFTRAPSTGKLLGCARKQLHWAHARSRLPTWPVLPRLEK